MAMTIQFQLNWTYPVQCCKKFWENTLHKVLIPVHIDIVFFSMAFSIFGDSLHLGPIEIAKGLSYIDIDKGSRQWPLVPPVQEMDCWRCGNSFGEKPHRLKFYLIVF